MQLQLHSQLSRLNLANEHLLQMYYVLYYDLPDTEKDMMDNLNSMVEIREKTKLKLRSHLFEIKNSIKAPAATNTVLEYLPFYSKLEVMARNTFDSPKWSSCYNKERRNIKAFYDTLYNQDIPSATIDLLLKQRKKARSFPKA